MAVAITVQGGVSSTPATKTRHWGPQEGEYHSLLLAFHTCDSEYRQVSIREGALAKCVCMIEACAWPDQAAKLAMRSRDAQSGLKLQVQRFAVGRRGRSAQLMVATGSILCREQLCAFWESLPQAVIMRTNCYDYGSL